ncbi:MAG: TonB-dependent receptor [Novosphingobium sp.]
MNMKSAYRSLLVAGVALSAFPATVWAQAAADGTANADAIVVTGQRQQYRGDVPLKELPQTVQVIDSKQLNTLNITRLDAALDLASGVSRQNNFGGLWDAFAVRGFAGDENFPSGFLVNGFNGGRGYGGARDASNIERIEVLKGPNGAVFGRGEPGGTVNIITKKASTTSSFGSFDVSAGSYNDYRVQGDYNLALNDKIAIRVNGAVEDADSFRDYVHTTKVVASPSILFKPTSSTSLTYELEYVDQKVPFERGVIAINGVLGLVPRTRFFGEPGDGPTHVKVLGHQVQLQQNLGSNDWVFIGGFGYRHTTFQGYSSDPELALSRQIIDNDGINLVRQRRFRDYSTSNTVFRAEISGKVFTGPLTHHVLFGADWDKFNIDLHQFRFRANPYVAGSPITSANNAVNVFAPVYGNMPVPTIQITNSLETQTAYGAYFQDQIDVTDKLKVRFGGRYDHFRQLINNRNVAPPLNISDKTKEKFSPTAGILYQITDTLSIYGGYGTGFRPNSGTGKPDAVTLIASPFEPETSKSYEGGFRYTSPGNRITASIAAYTMTKTNILVSNPLDTNFSIAGGSAKSQGIEAELDAKLPGDVQVYATYAYTDARWSSISKDPNFSAAILPGDPLINIPKHSANLLVTKGFDLGNSGKLTVGAGVNHVSKRLGETATTFYIPSYTITRLLASYEPTEHIRIGVDVTNLFDVTYYASSYSQYWIQPGAPRTITGRVSFSF